jgi:hypothetical protein
MHRWGGEIALLAGEWNTDNKKGQSGSGTLLGIVVKGIAPGSSAISILQENAKDTQQRPIQLVTSEASVQMKP